MRNKMLWGAAALVWAAAAVPGVAQWAGDRAMTRAEMEAKVQERFVRLDGNRDGYVTQAEMPVRAGRGGVTMEQRFERRDRNRDGVLTREEFAGGAMERGHRGGRGMHGGRMAAMLFGVADRNRDGRVSLPEAQGIARQAFDRADTNRDGSVTRDERRAAFAQFRMAPVPRPAIN